MGPTDRIYGFGCDMDIVPAPGNRMCIDLFKQEDLKAHGQFSAI